VVEDAEDTAVAARLPLNSIEFCHATKVRKKRRLYKAENLAHKSSHPNDR
jgi:hypothetical protein